MLMHTFYIFIPRYVQASAHNKDPRDGAAAARRNGTQLALEPGAVRDHGAGGKMCR